MGDSLYSSSYQKAAVSSSPTLNDEDNKILGNRNHWHVRGLNRIRQCFFFSGLVIAVALVAFFGGGLVNTTSTEVSVARIQEKNRVSPIISGSGTSTVTTSSIIHRNSGDSHLQGSPHDQHYLYHRRTKIVEALRDLQASLQGTVYFPDDDEGEDSFSRAAHVWSERSVITDRVPWAIIEVHNEADVQATVPVLAELKRQYDFPFRIRSGGHNKAGYSTVPEGAVISLVRLNHISVHPRTLPGNNNNKNNTKSSRRKQSSDALAKMGPAVLVEQFVESILVKHGFGGVIGYCGTVAEGGFVLGGGIGMQSRLYGLGLDSVAGLRIVLADGSVRYVSNSLDDDDDDANSQELRGLNTDLFWALRGAGGGNFGVVTEIEYHLHKANDRCVFFALSLQPDAMASFLYRLGEVESELPGNIMVMHDLVDTASILWTGPDETALEGSAKYLDSLIESLVPRKAPRAINRTEFLWSEMYNPQFATFLAVPPTWAASCWYGFMLPESNTEEIWHDIMAHISEGVKASAPFLLPDIELWGGAIHNTAWNDTAFPYRSAVYNVGVLLTIPADAPTAESVFHENVAKVNAWWPQVTKYLTGSYVNYPMASIVEHDYPRMYWGDNLERLVNIKKRVDPDDVFQFPLSVPINL